MHRFKRQSSLLEKEFIEYKISMDKAIRNIKKHFKKKKEEEVDSIGYFETIAEGRYSRPPI